MPNTLEYIERAAKRTDPESAEYFELTRQYAQELNRVWASGEPLPWRDAIDHDKMRDYPRSFSPVQLPGNGTKAWQTMARRAGVQLSLIEEAPARVELARMAEAVIPEYLTKTKHERTTLLDVVLMNSRREMRTWADAPKYRSQLDRAINHLRAIVRRARELGFYPSDEQEQTTQAA